MKAKDTVMSPKKAGEFGYQVSTDPREDKAFTHEDNTLVGGDRLLFMRTQKLLEAQAEISFKAGTRVIIDLLYEWSNQPSHKRLHWQEQELIKETKRATLKQVVEWMEEDCPHHPLTRRVGKQMPRKNCEKCWQELKQQSEEGR